MSKPVIFLTGAQGMLGSNILEHQLSDEFDFLTPSRATLNLMNRSQVRQFYQDKKPDIVIHAAGLVGGIQANIAAPVNFLVDNLQISQNVILEARDVGVKKLINIASSCMYPRNINGALTEDMILKGELEPTNEGYALAKIFATRLCQYIKKEDSRFQYKTLIPCNLYGRHDKFNPKHSHLLPAIIHKIHAAKINNYEAVEIWGDGTARREFMYAGDLADLILKALGEVELLPDVMNVGLGVDYTINEYYEIVGEIVGWKGKYIHNLNQPVGMMQKLTSIYLLNEYGWSAPTSISLGIQRTYDFYKEISNEF